MSTLVRFFSIFQGNFVRLIIVFFWLFFLIFGYWLNYCFLVYFFFQMFFLCFCNILSLNFRSYLCFWKDFFFLLTHFLLYLLPLRNSLEILFSPQLALTSWNIIRHLADLLLFLRHSKIKVLLLKFHDEAVDFPKALRRASIPPWLKFDCSRYAQFLVLLASPGPFFLLPLGSTFPLESHPLTRNLLSPSKEACNKETLIPCSF